MQLWHCIFNNVHVNLFLPTQDRKTSCTAPGKLHTAPGRRMDPRSIYKWVSELGFYAVFKIISLISWRLVLLQEKSLETYEYERCKWIVLSSIKKNSKVYETLQMW